MFKKLLTMFLVICSVSIYAQTTINGKVYDEYLEPFSNAVVLIGSDRTTSSSDGTFILATKSNYPFIIQVSAFGYKTELIEVTSKEQEINIILKENTALDEVVISASRSPERVIESPVTIERIGINDIKKNTSVTYYDGMANLKGIDLRESGYGFKSINTRGFSSFENTRFVQLVDGMDTAVPALTFSMGNLAGTSDLDVESVEVLPGAASALYGANAFNGIMLLKSKNPFKHSGISTYFKTGFTSQDAAGNNPFYDFGIRMAYKFNEKIAGKVNLTYYKSEEWHANNTGNSTGIGGVAIGGDRTLPGYDGINVYGDEVGATLKQIATEASKTNPLITPAIINSLPDEKITRTGYDESSLVDYDSNGLKFDASLHYRPWENENLEIIWNSRFARGKNIYQGANRYVQDGFSFEQHRLEFLGKNFFLRGYYSANDSGDYFDSRFKAININRAWKSDKDWFGDYLNAYLTQGRSHGKARDFANIGRFEPGSVEFNAAANDVASKTVPEGGAKLTDQTSYYHADGNYNFRDIIKFGEIQIGGSYRKINLNSQGSVFTDANSKISFDEFGVYTQLQKKFLEERLKFTGSIRYDKSTNFKGNYSPRVSLNYALGENKDHVIRASYQTGFRNPTLQEQYFGLPIGTGHLIGGVDENLDRYIVNIGGGNTLTGRDAFENSFSRAELDRGNLVKSQLTTIKPEKVISYELGYRSIVNLSSNKILELDVNGYYNNYESFTAIKDVLVPHYGGFNADGTPNAQALLALQNNDVTAFSVNTNSKADVTSYGVGVGMSTKVFKGFDLGLSYNYAKFDFEKTSDPDFEPAFNTPEHKVKVQFGHPNLFKNFGFNINARWQDEYYWQSSFLQGLVDARTVIDAQINYTVPAIKSRFKIGGTNLTGKEYFIAPGAGAIGSLYYISWTIND
ncbi:CarboxypepD_reg-like domain-containing protein [Tenacibaculum mesophilum]|uniref:TonB-dependent receptor n=1 Tax=Tenacibaculum mesophilum TaxID=104268 RepID=A0ABN5T5Y8_9FLAO|nr:TonB-dependent receptor [Tenacibaculum mesophilum]AZJ32791.1 TonB-dependent receptor [Tenacibaculum mesophilum]QFS28039.1 TonB-dependent receptor plug domain-containing protein [Tenacibaculum mesophilum]SHF74193.1 CarboxypepD_reg-like domain-containing protein [Tenacibaculum mesophilum]